MAFVLLLLFITLSYVYPGEIFPELAPYRITYYVGMAGLALSALWMARRSAPLKTAQLWLLAGFTVTLGISRMIADQWLGAPITVVQRFGPSITMFVLAVSSLNSVKKIRAAAFLIVVLSVIVTLQGAAAYHLGYQSNMFVFDPVTRAEYVASADSEGVPDASYDTEDESDQTDVEGAPLVKRIRGLGVLADPNDLALALVLAVALLGGAWTPKSTLRNALLVGVPAAVLCYGVFLTHSRGGTLALLVTLWRAATLRVGRIRAVLLLVVLAGGAAALNFGGGRQLISTADESASGRLTAWTEGIEMLKSSPVLGVGYQQFREYHTLTAHNSFVLCFAESGVLGYFFWLGLLVVTFLQLRGFRRLPDQEPLDRELKQWAVTLELAMVGFLTGAFFLSRTYVPMLYLILGLSVALILLAKEARRPVWSPPLPQMIAVVLAAEAGSMLLIYGIVKLHLA